MKSPTANGSNREWTPMNANWRSSLFAFIGVHSRLITLYLFLLIPFVICGADNPKPKPAKIKVSGYGLLGNQELKKTITLLHTYKDPENKPTILNADFLEDSAIIILSIQHVPLLIALPLSQNKNIQKWLHPHNPPK